jgi:23S rRNA pseudouridine2605 synthase
MLRINKFIAKCLQISRRSAEELIHSGQVKFNDRVAELTDRLGENDKVFYQNKELTLPKQETILIKFNKPVGYVCTHSSQGRDPSVFKLLPSAFAKLKIVGRLDKDTSGLVLLTDNGDLAHQLMHPSFRKVKIYQTELSRKLVKTELNLIQTYGVDIGDQRTSKFEIEPIGQARYNLKLEEGRNRQIRRTFKALGNEVLELQRLSLGEFSLDNLKPGEWVKI